MDQRKVYQPQPQKSQNIFKHVQQREYDSKMIISTRKIYIDLQCIHCKAITGWNIYLDYYYCDNCCKCSNQAINPKRIVCNPSPKIKVKYTVINLPRYRMMMVAGYLTVFEKHFEKIFK